MSYDPIFEKILKELLSNSKSEQLEAMLKFSSDILQRYQAFLQVLKHMKTLKKEHRDLSLMKIITINHVLYKASSIALDENNKEQLYDLLSLAEKIREKY